MEGKAMDEEKKEKTKDNVVFIGEKPFMKS